MEQAVEVARNDKGGTKRVWKPALVDMFGTYASEGAEKPRASRERSPVLAACSKRAPRRRTGRSQTGPRAGQAWAAMSSGGPGKEGNIVRCSREGLRWAGRKWPVGWVETSRGSALGC